MHFIDTHAHLDGVEFDADRDEVVARAQAAGVSKVFIPAVNLPSVDSILAVCRRYPGYALPMIGLHPEDVKADWRDVLDCMRARLDMPDSPFAFEEQVRWSVETRLPLMIHCRKAQNEMVRLLRPYAKDLPGGVFHCFTGNEKEAAELLQFDNFMLGIGGVLTFKKSHLPEVLPAAVPLSRVVLETDAPYMAPVPMRGKRNESAYVAYVLGRLAECYGVGEDYVASVTTENARKVFGI